MIIILITIILIIITIMIIIILILMMIVIISQTPRQDLLASNYDIILYRYGIYKLLYDIVHDNV